MPQSQASENGDEAAKVLEAFKNGEERIHTELQRLQTAANNAQTLKTIQSELDKIQKEWKSHMDAVS